MIRGALRWAWGPVARFTILHRASPVGTLDDRCLLVFTPHSDDETLGCGGLIAMKRRLGARVVVCVTDGVASNDDVEGSSGAALAEIRRVEVAAALAVLGVARADLRFLGLPDARLPELDDGARAAAVVEIRRLLDETLPDVVCVPFRTDGHLDHVETNRLVAEASAPASAETSKRAAS